MLGEKWTIYWNEYASDTYLYGSEIKFHKKDDVEFLNRLMPPGTVIKQWYSKTNFQMQHIEPSLPIIDGEGQYMITINMDTEEGENALFRLVFYDRYGMTKFHFHSVVIQEVIDGTEEKTTRAK